MTGRHAREAALLDMESIPRIFTLREFGRRVSVCGTRPRSQEVVDYISMVGEGRMSSQLGSGGTGDDIADPYGRRKRAYKQAAAGIETEIQKTLSALYP